MPESTITAPVAAVRQFNRFYTRRIGVLQETLVKSAFSLTEVRVLYELAHRDAPSARDLAVDLGLDTGYLSRILRRFVQQRLVAQVASPRDGRQRTLSLTPLGRRTFAGLDTHASDEVARLLTPLTSQERRGLVEAMRTIESLLGTRRERTVPYVLRAHQPGDMGWVVQRNAALYTHEYGWNDEYEALVATITARFLERFDPRRERCWIAERDGERVGCVFLVKKSKTVAQLRLLLVEPSARGLGLGHRLVDECERFARQAGYRKIMLWTNSVLTAARHVYEKAGYRLVTAQRHKSFGKQLTGQTWEKDL